MQVSLYGSQWLTFKQQEVGAATLYTYRRLLENTVYPLIGGREMDSISPVELQSLLIGTLEAFSENEALKLRALLRGMFGHAYQLDILDRNPAEKIRLPRGVGSRRIRMREVPSTAHAQAMAEAIDPRYRLMPLLAAFAGLRWQEVAALKPEDFDLKVRELSVNRALGRHDGVKAPKTDAGRRHTVWATEIHEEVVAHILVATGDDWLFTSRQGALLHYSNWRRRSWLPSCQLAGLAWTFHQYRHTFAVESLKRGRSVQSVASMMGHSNPRVTWEFYAGLFDDHLDEARNLW
jgi:integrase